MIEPVDFAHATAVRAAGAHRFVAQIDETWSAPNGPNGGYLAAILARAALAATPDPDKSLRSLTCHYMRPPAGGEVQIDVTVERAGNAIATLSLRMTQDGAPCVVAIASLGVALASAGDYADATMPDVLPPAVKPSPVGGGRPPILAHMLSQVVLGDEPFSGGEEAMSGAWIACTIPTPTDAPALCFYVDAWLPAPWTRLEARSFAPTIDLTIHLRAPLPHPSAQAGDPVLVRVRSETSADGYCDEDAHVWAADGTLLAQSRQLALLRPAK